MGPARPPPANGYEGAALHPGLVVGDSSTSSDRIQGGALRTFRVDAAVESVEVRLLSEGYPIYGAIEVLQGPNTERQVIELYSENGRDRPISYLLETPGFGCVVSVKNTWPSMEYPMTALVLPHVVSPRGWGGWQAGQRRDGYDGVGVGGQGGGQGGRRGRSRVRRVSPSSEAFSELSSRRAGCAARRVRGRLRRRRRRRVRPAGGAWHGRAKAAGPARPRRASLAGRPRCGERRVRAGLWQGLGKLLLRMSACGVAGLNLSAQLDLHRDWG